jgi:flagellin
MLIRIRELVVQASNDTYVGGEGFQSDRLRMQDEIDQLMDEIDAIATRTEFNTLRVLDGSFGTEGIPGIASVTAGLAAQTFTATSEITVYGTVTATTALAETMTVFGTVTGILSGVVLTASTAAIGDPATPADYTPEVPEVTGTQIGSSTGTVTANTAIITETDANIAATAHIVGTFRVNGTAASVVTSTEGAIPGRELWFQTGANASQGIEVNIENMNTGRLFGLPGFRHMQNDVRIINVLGQFGYEVQDGTGVQGDPANGSVFNSTIGGFGGIDNTLDAIDAALAIVTRQRSTLGAVQNRLEYTIENLDISSENLQAANSRIRDADMAREMMRLTQANVLQQAAISMLAQANQAPQSVLQLLG